MRYVYWKGKRELLLTTTNDVIRMITAFKPGRPYIAKGRWFTTKKRGSSHLYWGDWMVHAFKTNTDIVISRRALSALIVSGEVQAITLAGHGDTGYRLTEGVSV